MKYCKKNGVKHHSSNPIYMYKMYISSQAIYCSITVLVLISIFASFVLCHNCYHCPFLFPYCPYTCTTEIKYKIAQSTSFMLCMSYRYINKTSPLFLSHPLIFFYFGVMVFNATFNNISVISWRSVLLMEETGVPGGNHRPVASH